MKLSNVLVIGVLVATLAGCAREAGLRGRTAASPGQAEFTFVTIGDSRSDSPIVQPQAYRDCIKLINKLDPPPAFVINVGDLILGYTDGDEELTKTEWDEFDRVTAGFKPPVRLVPGNHDIWDEASHATFRKRYGPTHYSFDHGDSHFTVLCSEETGEVAKIAGTQLEWLEKDLQQHQQAAHRFVFLHRPLWGKHRGMETSGWDETVHPLLVKYGVDTVYAGHDHQYVNYGVRDGVQYYVTGGGGAGLAGGGNRSVGGFHHFMITTVAPGKVSSIVVESDGTVQPDTVVTHERIEAYDKLIAAVALAGVELPPQGNRLAVKQTIKNPFPGRLEIRYRWRTQGTGWTMSPAQQVLTIPAGGKTEMQATATFDRSRLMPAPTLEGTALLDGKEITTIEQALQPLVRRSTVAVRLAASPKVDGKIDPGEYGNAPWSGGFVDYRGKGYPKRKSRFVVGYDDRALYIAVEAEENDPGSITVEPRERDGDIWRDDDVEVFIDATLDRKTYHQFSVNLNNNQYDGIGGPTHGQFGDPKWNAKWQSAVKIGEGSFVMEFAIPFKALAVAPPKPGDRWGLNIARQRQATNESQPEPEMSAWSIPYANFHVPSHFGTVTFK